MKMKATQINPQTTPMKTRQTQTKTEAEGRPKKSGTMFGPTSHNR